VSVFYLVVRGERLEVATWKRVATKYAAALDLAAGCAQWRIADGGELLIAIFGHPRHSGGTRGGIISTVLDKEDSGIVELQANEARPGTATSVLVNPITGSVRLRVPFASPDQAYRWRGPAASLFTNDLRLATARQRLLLDPHGVYALLQYGAIPAPFTLFRGVERILPGHEACLDSALLTRLPQPGPLPVASASDETEAALLTRIDDVLLGTRRPSAIFFSGGVDSSLLAARIAAAGLRDVPLLNYAFGPDDPEAAHARRVAAHLGMPIERIQPASEKPVDVLSRATLEYSYPFGDYSSLPTNLLVRATTARLPRGSEVVDGTGADGVFAVGRKAQDVIRSQYEPLGSLAPWIGQLAARFHAWSGLTASDGRIAAAARLIRRVTMMPPLLAAVIAQNSLQDECFYATDEVRTAVNDALMHMVASLTPSTSLADEATTLDVTLVCGGIFAAKDFDPLRHRGIDAVYPFLHPDVLGPSLALPWSTRCAGGQPKALLKRALTRHVPADLVFRKKSGFRPRVESAFSEVDMRDFVRDCAFRRDSPLREFLNLDPVEHLFSRAFDAKPIHTKAYNLLWAVAFVGGWIDGLTRLTRVQEETAGGRAA
jgi:asparagine synthase (glutamine-hydrolysing)